MADPDLPAPHLPDDPRAVQLVLDELAARLRVLREGERLDFLGQMPDVGSSWLSMGVSVAFMIAAPVALLAIGWSTGPVAWGLVGLAVLLGSVAALLVIPAARRERRLLHEGVLLPVALVAVDERARDPANELTRMAYGVLCFEPELNRRPRELVAIADRVRTALALEARGGGEEASFVRAVAPRVRALGAVGPRRRVPDALSPDFETWFVEFILDPTWLPSGHLDTRLVFCLAHPAQGGACRTRFVQSEGVWGERAIELAQAFPDRGEPLAEADA